MIIAIDGPAGSGKSTTAREVARRLGFLYVDTGAMYRAVALHFLQNDVAVTDEAAAACLDDVRVSLEPLRSGLRVRLGDRDVTDEIRRPDVSRMSSRVSALQPVRAFLVSEQRRIVRTRHGSGVVVEGRDIGTVVFPGAEVKIFLTASSEARAARRAAELHRSGTSSDEATVRSEMEERDRHDASRAISPLRAAPDAVVIDTTALSFEDQVTRIVGLVRSAIEERADPDE